MLAPLVVALPTTMGWLGAARVAMMGVFAPLETLPSWAGSGWLGASMPLSATSGRAAARMAAVWKSPVLLGVLVPLESPSLTECSRAMPGGRPMGVLAPLVAALPTAMGWLGAAAAATTTGVLAPLVVALPTCTCVHIMIGKARVIHNVPIKHKNYHKHSHNTMSTPKK